MIRNGIFCIVNGMEYRLSKDIDGKILIITEDKSKIDNFFIDRYKSGVYSKYIDKNDITKIYKVNTIGEVDNLTVNVESELDNCYIVGTSDLKVAERLNLQRCDKYYYKGKILKENIKLTEQIEDI